ncbi:MAG: hypothetical protein ACK56I_10890, partial [bacterium]
PLPLPLPLLLPLLPPLLLLLTRSGRPHLQLLAFLQLFLQVLLAPSARHPRRVGGVAVVLGHRPQPGLHRRPQLAGVGGGRNLVGQEPHGLVIGRQAAGTRGGGRIFKGSLS